MTDLIDRQAAIDAVGSMLRRKFGVGGDLAEITLADLPSVQPENTILKAINNIRALTGCEELIITDKNSMRTWDANGVEYKLYPERKRGKWETEIITDACGHKHVYFACSVCGKASEDEFCFCPNCGAEQI